MEGAHPVVQKIEREFRAHLENRPGTEYVASEKISAELSRLTRDLESKRQFGTLSDAERNFLRDIDQIWERISRYNQDLKKADPPPGTNLYDLSKQKVSSEPVYEKPVIIPSVSDKEADEIISHLNEQFEEKILKKLRAEGKQISLAPEAKSVEDHIPEKMPEHPGRSLNDFLSTVRASRPKLPFMDEDSHFDLSKLKTKPGHGTP